MEFYGSIEAKDRFGVVGQFGFVGYGFMGVLCCSETRQVEVVVSKDWWLCWLCCCDGPHGKASGAKPRSVLMVKPRLFLTTKPQVVGVVKPTLVPTAKPHLYLSSIMLY